MFAMTYSYYPGCTLRNKAKDLDAYARASAEALGFRLEEIPDWQCCGGVNAHLPSGVFLAITIASACEPVNATSRAVIRNRRWSNRNMAAC